VEAGEKLAAAAANFQDAGGRRQEQVEIMGQQAAVAESQASRNGALRVVQPQQLEASGGQGGI
jgi:hypothetical protein